MERIKPIDLDKASLPRVMRGYDTRIVDALLDRSAKEIEELLTELRASRNECEHLRAEVQTYRDLESSLKDALIVAQKAADETRVNARRDGEALLEEARRKASEEQHLLAAEIKTLATQIDALRREKDRFVRQFRVLLEDHLRELSQDFEPVKAVIEDLIPEPAPTPAE